MYQTAHSIHLRQFLFIVMTASEEIAFQNHVCKTTDTNEVKHRFKLTRRSANE